MSQLPIQPDPRIIALGIRQPWAELILRGVKTIEVRSQGTQIRGTIYVYAARKLSDLPAAHAAMTRHGLHLSCLPRGKIVGSVEISGCRLAEATDVERAQVPAELLAGQQAWQLQNPHRFEPPLPIQSLPYGIWFYPFRTQEPLLLPQ